MLTVYHSNRLERLADELGRVLGRAVGSPLSSETVVVPNNGMARWLSLQLSDRLGICANIRFEFPAEFIWQVFRATLQDVPARPGFDPAIMTWRILATLKDIPADPVFAPVRAYLVNGEPLNEYELARRIATMFDQYLVYRPDWITRWERGEDRQWQAGLWRRLVASTSENHWVSVQAAFLSEFATGCSLDGLPARVTLFGIPTLSPAYLNIVAALGERVDLNLHLLNPCQEFWGDIVPERDRARRTVNDSDATMYLETGNGLLASLGKQGRDFIDQLQEFSAQDKECFEPPGEDCLLHCIQTDMLELRDRGTDGRDRITISPQDRSVLVHVCHSAMREVEVLYDQLLDCFACQPDLSPSDVVVLVPDIEAYAPYIEAVFSTRDVGPQIPYAISDRTLPSESQILAGLFDLLDLSGSRYDANTVLALLEVPAVRRRFGLDEDDLVLVHRWARETRIRWGIDETSRADLGLPSVRMHSWRAGLDRLLLGYALPGENVRLFAGVLPFDGVEGGDALLVGRLQSFIESTVALQRDRERKRSVDEWASYLHVSLERFFAPDEDEENELGVVRQAIDAMAESAERAEYRSAVDLEVINAELRHRLNRVGPGGRFLSGQVTFCELVPMRSIPFQVVCLIGMNDGAYPRTHRPLSFDLMAQAPRRGDRSRRSDDRYQFLETLLSARRRLYISYVGRDIRDDSVIPPSVLICELLDYIRQGYCAADQGGLEAQLVVQHPLQAFSPRYFRNDSQLFSYSQELCDASRAAGDQAHDPVRLFENALPEPEPEWQRVELEQLIRFFSNPTRYLLQQRMGIYFEESDGPLETREPFSLDRNVKQSLRHGLLENILNGAATEQLRAVAHAGGLLPHGQPGDSLFETEQAYVIRFSDRLKDELPAQTLDPVPFDIQIGEMRLTGQLKGVSQDGLVEYRLDKLYAEDRLRQWIRHLVLNSLDLEVEKTSRLIAEDAILALNPIADEANELQSLLKLYWQGLHYPLQFFPKSSWEYVQQRNEPLSAARKIWQGSEFAWGESENSYFQQVFAGWDPLDKEFEALSTTIFGPMREHQAAG